MIEVLRREAGRYRLREVSRGQSLGRGPRAGGRRREGLDAVETILVREASNRVDEAPGGCVEDPDTGAFEGHGENRIAASRVALLFHHCVANPDATTASLYCPAPRSGTTKLPSERVTANATIEPFVAFNTSTRPPATGVSPSPGVVTVP